jgi:tetratricopeptide (TPR) repeat protein
LSARRPEYDPQALKAANGALSAGDLPRAIEVARQALVRGGGEHPLLLSLVAHDLELQGEYAHALTLLNRALELNPRSVDILQRIGGARTKAGRARDALAAFDAAVAIDPNAALAHYGRGLSLAGLNDHDGARAAYQRALALAPGDAETLGALATMAAEDKDPVAARHYADQALAAEPHQAGATMALVSLDAAAGEHEAVLARMDALIANGGLTLLHLASAERFRADALDALGRPNEAMTAYAAANTALRRVYLVGVEQAGVELGVEQARRLGAWFATARAADWRPASSHHPHAGATPAGHAFLIGFPRSGTTLLEQVLATHPDIVALEERPTLDPDVPGFFRDAAGLTRLAKLGPADADALRDAYWRRVREFGVEPDGKIFIDKMPLNSLYQPLIAKLFPHARIVFALRDPRDVVLGCFRRRFRPNPLVVEYTDLVRTAEFYDGVMTVAARYREVLPLPVHMHRYERLVDDFDAETKGLCAFLGIDWTDGLRDFAATARERDIRTPSADQVRRGLYREGVGQWRKYAESLAPALPILAPWVEAYGYEPG